MAITFNYNYVTILYMTLSYKIGTEYTCYYENTNANNNIIIR